MPLPTIPYLRVEAVGHDHLLSVGLMLKLPVAWQLFGVEPSNAAAPKPDRQIVVPPPPPRATLALRPLFGLQSPAATATYGAEATFGYRPRSVPLVWGAVGGVTRFTRYAEGALSYVGGPHGPQVGLEAGVVSRPSVQRRLGLGGTLWFMSEGLDALPVFPYLRLERYTTGAVFTGGLMARIRLWPWRT
jgi:hypothetical protein